jgi:hypothetical protein
MEDIAVLFDPIKDGEEKPTLLGVFPAHIVGYKEGNKYKSSIPYNVTFKIAPEAAELTGTNWKQKDEETSADYMPGREVRSVGIWLNPDPKPEERWKNRDYRNFLEAIGIELKTIEKGGQKFESLVTLEEAEALGRPCLVNIKLEKDKREADRVYPKVFGVQSWDNGERIDVTEDEPDVFATEVEGNPLDTDALPVTG